MSSTRDISNILRLLNEDPMVSGSTSNLTGAKYAQEAEMRDSGHHSLAGFNQNDLPTQDLTIGETFTEKEIRIGKRFIELAGGHERARDLLDKIIQSDHIFGITDDQADQAQIDMIAQSVPEEPDYPTDFSSRFNPSSY